MTTEGNQQEVPLTGFTPSVDEPSGADFGDSPLLDFWGVGAGYAVTGGMGRNNRPWQRVEFRFTDIEVLESKDVFPFGTAEISIFYNDPKNTPKRREGQGTNDWEALSESLREIYKDQANSSLDDAWGGAVIGKGTAPVKPGRRMHLKRIPVLLRVAPNPDSENPEHQTKWHDEIQPAWKVLEVDGVGSSITGGGTSNGGGGMDPLLDHVLSLADGKTLDQFYTAALDDAQVMGNPALVTQLTNRQFVQDMKGLGHLTQDSENVLHRAEKS